MKILTLKFTTVIVLLASFCTCIGAQPKPEHHLQFQTMPTQWYEGLPLGNGWLGVLAS